MATNSLAGINLAAIADDAIDFLGSDFFPVNLFSTNFSQEIRQKGESVTTRIVTGYSSQDVSSGYASNAQNSTTTPVTVTLNQFKGVPVEFKDLEITKAGNREWLVKHFFQPLKDATVGAFVGDLLALVVDANFTNKSTVALGSFDADSVADVRTALTKRKVSRPNRGLLLNSDYYGALLKDTSFSNKSRFGNDDAIKDGRLVRARGFDVYEYEGLPGNNENLTGLGCGRSALVFAARPVFKPEIAHARIENRVEPKTGLPFQFRIWYSPNNGRWYMSAGFLYGVKVGQAAALQRIVSA